MDRVYIVCPKCGKKLFRIEPNSVYDNIFIWCKNCKKEIRIEPLSRKLVEKR